jgi:hypothetical protein
MSMALDPGAILRAVFWLAFQAQECDNRRAIRPRGSTLVQTWLSLRRCLIVACWLVTPVLAIAGAAVFVLLRAEFPALGFSDGHYIALGAFDGSVIGLGAAATIRIGVWIVDRWTQRKAENLHTEDR